ncbi:MAG: hypothetical protein ACRDJ4_13230 [Actinomycetota bacterium]
MELPIPALLVARDRGEVGGELPSSMVVPVTLIVPVTSPVRPTASLSCPNNTSFTR